MNASTSSIALNNSTAPTSQLRQVAAMGIAEYLISYTEFTIGHDEQDKIVMKHGVEAMSNGLGGVVSAWGSREVEQAQIDEQQQRVSALIVHACVTGVVRKAFTKVRDAGVRVWNRFFGRRPERALGE